MSYLVLARKYRPRTFDDVIGQDHITNSLRKAVENGRVHHAYLFCGPRGVGKTTCARILARELNRLKSADPSETLELDSDMDVIEIDGASNRGIDEIRTLRENVKFVPMSGRYKIYIVDEVHMLTPEAFNALLKTLEEPPEHVKFIFATTDPNKLPMTVVSRCEPYYFKRIPLETMVSKLQEICAKEGFTAEEEALYSIAKAAQGSMRDALSVMDQLISFSDGKVRSADVNGMLGVVETQLVFDLADALAARDCAASLTITESIISKGKDIRNLSQNLLEHFRHLMVMKVGGKQLESLIDYPKAFKETLFNQAGKFNIQTILRAIDLLIEAQETARITESPRIALELTLAKLTCAEAVPAAVPPSRPAAAGQPAPASAAHARPAAAPVTRPAPAVAPKTVKPPEARPSSTGGFINNNKGVIDLSPAASDIAPPAEPAISVNVSLEDIRQRWNELTHAVSQKRISIGTYLQEGQPSALERDKLYIAFTPEHMFHKECIDTVENQKLIAEVISESLGVRLSVGVVIADQVVRESSQQLDDAVKMFQGELVNEWHSDQEEE
ncbi:MAG: DNA polymerase III subunit gamma/tau [Candidatus Omnitrophica bacterium]|nr:DNA polymerase III subunit gamma/tau [Candidatus Omnitrophota bacterium]